MELREYWRIVRRRLWVVAAMFLVVGLVSVAVRPTIVPRYHASMRFVLGIEPEPSTGEYYTYDKYYTWLTAEYLIDDTAALVRSAGASVIVAGTALFGAEDMAAVAAALRGS